MKLKESIAQEVIYNLSVLYKILLITGVFLFFASVLMIAFNLFDSNILPENEFISDNTLLTSLFTSVLFIIISFIFRYFRNTIQVKTRSFRTENCRR